MNTEKTKPTLEEIVKLLEKKLEILCLGKVWYLQELLALVKTINLLFVEHGKPAWRLPTREELQQSFRKNDKKFGEWYTWTGDDDSFNSFNGVPILWIVNMCNNEESSDSDGSQVEAYLIQDKPKV